LRQALAALGTRLIATQAMTNDQRIFCIRQ
jgi:hypothetical protein